MLPLILPRQEIWTRQPKGVRGLDVSSPFFRSVKAAFTAEFDAVTLSSVKSTGEPLCSGNSGIGYNFSGYGYAQIARIGYVPPPFTILFVAKKSTAAIDSIISFGGASVGYGWQIQTGGISTSGRITYGGVADYTAIPSFYEVGTDAIYAVSVAATTARFFRNGRFIGSCAVGSAHTNKPTQSLTLGAAYNGSAYVNKSTSTIYGGALLSGALSDSDVAKLSENPWQIFAPRETRLFVPVSYIGGSYTLTAQAGIYSLTGQPAQLLKSKLLTSSGGTYQHVGADASLYRSRQLSLSGGSYSFSGASADITFTGLSANYILTAQGGIYSLVGSSADITYTALSPSYLLTAQGGTYNLSGNDIDLRKSKRVTASGGVYSYIGQQVNITAGPAVVSTLVRYINVLTGEILLLQPF